MGAAEPIPSAGHLILIGRHGMLFRGYLEANIAGTLSFVHSVYIKTIQRIVIIIKTSKIRNMVSYIEKYFENYVHSAHILSVLRRKTLS